MRLHLPCALCDAGRHFLSRKLLQAKNSVKDVQNLRHTVSCLEGVICARRVQKIERMKEGRYWIGGSYSGVFEDLREDCGSAVPAFCGRVPDVVSCFSRSGVDTREDIAE